MQLICATRRVVVIANLALICALAASGCNADDGWIVRHDEPVDDAPRLCRYPLGMLADERARLAEAAGKLETGPETAPRQGEPNTDSPTETPSPAAEPATEPEGHAQPEAHAASKQKKKKKRKRRKKGASRPSHAPAKAGACIDLATASAGELEALPGVGPSLARRIVEARAQRPFTSTSQLVRVKGIGATRARKIAPLLCPM